MTLINEIQQRLDEDGARHVLGVLGGMGPLASAEFLKTIYETTLDKREQMAPTVVMYSDPTFPDRTEALLSGSYQFLLDRLILALGQLAKLGASKMVICCVTAHYLLPEIPDGLRAKVISLVDLILAETAVAQRKQLLLCTNATRQLNIFQLSDRWQDAGKFVVLPEEAEQSAIHELIYQIKRNYSTHLLTPFLDSLLAKYKVDSFIVGCTELHLLAKSFLSRNGGPQVYSCIDPLDIIASRLRVKCPI